MSYFSEFLLELCKTLEHDGQEIKILTRIRGFILDKICCFYQNENEYLKNSDFCYTWSNDNIQ